MKKIKSLEPKILKGIPSEYMVVSVRVSSELKKALTMIGGGRPSKGLNQVLNAYEDEIYMAAANTKKAS